MLAGQGKVGKEATQVKILWDISVQKAFQRISGLLSFAQQHLSSSRTILQ